MPLAPNSAVIFKYQIPVMDRVHITMPERAQILSIQNQRDEITLWAIVDQNAETETRTFRVIGTGEELPESLGLEYLASVQIRDTYVWHVFEDTSGKL